MMELLQADIVRPIPALYQVPVSDIVMGFLPLKSGQNFGKTVATMSENDNITAYMASPLARDYMCSFTRCDTT
jgi:hypothetical protein